MKVTEAPTKIYRSFNGIEGRTIRTEKGQTFEITTMKRYSGHLVTIATESNIEEDGSFFISQMGKNFLSIDHGKIRCTENIVKDAHFKGLAAFDIKVSELPETAFVAPEFAEIGDILFLDGYNSYKGSEDNNWIIYDIQADRWSKKNFLCIEKDSLKLQTYDHIRPYSKKFGIGIYFEKGFNMSKFGIDQNKLSDMLIEAQDVKKQALEAQRIADEKAKIKADEKKAYLSQFVQADRRKTTSLIKAHCLKTWKIAKIEITSDKFSMGSSMDVTYYAPEKIKELENFIDNFQYGHFDGMQDMYEYSNSQDIIIDGHILQQTKYVHCRFEECEIPVKQDEKQPETNIFDWDELLEPEKSELFEIIETKHTLKGFDLFVVSLANRVSKDVFNDLLSTAKSFGGWYSAFNKNGAIPGFQFKNKESALKFSLNII